MKPKCANFETCGTYTNAEHSKWCHACSLRWQFKRMGYIPEFSLTENGKIIGMVLTREDIYEKHQGINNGNKI